MVKKITCGTVGIPQGETLFYRERDGGSRIILLIHGNLSSSRHFEPIMSLFPDTCRVFALDLRGMGKSTYNHSFNSLGELAEDVKSFMEKKKLNDALVVGWSTGGAIAMELATRYPERVEKLVLLNSISCKGYPLYRKDETLKPIIGANYLSKIAMAEDPIQIKPLWNSINYKDYFAMQAVWDALVHINKKPDLEEYKALLDATFEQRNLVDIAWSLANFNLCNSDNKIEKLKQPVLALWGENDLVVKRHMVEETVEAIGGNARMEILKNTGHSPIVDCPEILVEKIWQFANE